MKGLLQRLVCDYLNGVIRGKKAKQNVREDWRATSKPKTGWNSHITNQTNVTTDQ